jgi:transposase
MKDTELYERILGLAKPWHVTDVRLDEVRGELRVRVECDEVVWACPQCAKRMHVHSHKEREWRHLDTCQYKTVIESDVLRVECQEHGTMTVQVTWAERCGRETRQFEAHAIDVMKQTSGKAAAAIMRITWDEMDGIKQRAVDRGVARKVWTAPKVVCLDEKAAGRGQDYVTVATRVEGGRAVVDDVVEERTRAAADSYFERYTKEELAHVECIGMDMWKNYYNSAVAHVPGAAEKIVHDRFHLVTDLNEALDDVRRAERAQSVKKGEELKGTRRLWLYGKENVPDEERGRFKTLVASKLRTAKAWMLKELFRDMYVCKDGAEARVYFKDWYNRVMRSRIEPMMKVARRFKKHAANILTWFTHRLSNSYAEGVNNLIQSVVKKAYGYRNRARFMRDILFHAGGLDLYPRI